MMLARNTQNAEEVGAELQEMQNAIASAPKASGYGDLMEPKILHRSVFLQDRVAFA